MRIFIMYLFDKISKIRTNKKIRENPCCRRHPCHPCAIVLQNLRAIFSQKNPEKSRTNQGRIMGMSY